MPTTEVGPNIELPTAHANALFGLLAKTVTAEAIIQNGWDVQRYWRAPLRAGEVPNGVVLCERRPPRPSYIEGQEFLTVEFNLSEAGKVSFASGHYDLTWSDAVVDFTARCAGKVD